jgi:hypothetical protein
MKLLRLLQDYFKKGDWRFRTTGMHPGAPPSWRLLRAAASDRSRRDAGAPRVSCRRDAGAPRLAKCFSNMLSLAMLMVFTLSAADAARLSFEGGAAADEIPSVQVDLPLAEAGGLTLPAGTIAIKDSLVDIRCVPPGLFDRRTVLSGALVQAVREAGAGKPVIKGIVYFYGGAWLSYLGVPVAGETVTTQDGKSLTGRIIAGDEKSLTLRLADSTVADIACGRIARLQSPRAFTFVIPMLGAGPNVASFQAEALNMRLTPAAPSAGGLFVAAMPRTRLLGDDPGIKKRSIAAFMLTDFITTIAPAIALPMVVGRPQKGPENVLKAFNLWSAGQTGFSPGP